MACPVYTYLTANIDTRYRGDFLPIFLVDELNGSRWNSPPAVHSFPVLPLYTNVLCRTCFVFIYKLTDISNDLLFFWHLQNHFFCIQKNFGLPATAFVKIGEYWRCRERPQKYATFPNGQFLCFKARYLRARWAVEPDLVNWRTKQVLV